MVGFGSSLRMSRRRGWERAYLNYESLKLLLTQIEAAYEECEADNNAPAASGGGRRTDYRDELFLVDDSDGAFGLSDCSSCRSSSSSISSWDDDDSECPLDDDEAPGGGGGYDQFQGNFFVVMGEGGLTDAPDSAGNGQRRKRGVFGRLRSRCPVQFGAGNPLAKSSSEDTGDNTTGTNFTGGTRRGNVGYDFTPQSNRIRMAWDVPNSAGFIPEHELIYDRQGASNDGNDDEGQRQPLFDAGDGYGSTPIRQHPVDAGGGGAGGGERYGPADRNDFERVALLPSAAPANSGAGVTAHVNAGSNSGWSSWLQSPERHHQLHRQDQSGHFESAQPVAGETVLMSGEQGSAVSRNQPRVAVNASNALLSSTKQRKKKKRKNRRRASKYDVFRRQRGWNFDATDPLEVGGRGVGGGQTFASGAGGRGMIYHDWGENAYSAAVGQGVEVGVPMHQHQNQLQRSSGGKRRRTSRFCCCSRKGRGRRRRWRSCRCGSKSETKTSTLTPPQHIRIAHEKARAITGRFLGLLRAETEKVQLFAYARMGELSDTLGSLRFMEDQHHHHGTTNRNFDYDDMSEPSAGMHPSASSSSDEGGDVGATGFLGDVGPSFSSIEDRDMSRQVRAHVRTRQHVHRSPQRHHHQQKGWRRRRNRPIFQRSEQVIGEDSALLAAVDEADAYLAVAVELLHLIRFICVNAVAVRKIVKKHDKLLSNRMLGGYYHRERRRRQRLLLASSKKRKRNQCCPSDACGMSNKSKKNSRTVGSRVKLGGNAKNMCPREEISSRRENHVSPDLILQVTQNSRQTFPILDSDRLLGRQDAKIQKLVDCPQIETISASLAAILSEYEVSQSRADAFSRLQTSTSMDSEVDYVAKVQAGFPSPTVRTGENGVDSGQGNEDNLSRTSFSDGDGPPSTSSSISLMRLRYAVISILKFRQAARTRVTPMDAALSRHAMTYTGQNAVGESLNGSSRETLNFLLGYNAASVLVLDTDTLYDALTRGENAVFFASTEIKWWQDSDLNIFDDDHKSRSNCVEQYFCFSAQQQIVSSFIADRSHKQCSATPTTLLLNLCAAFLYTMNYYLIVPFAHSDVEQMGSNASISAILIGAASFGAIGAACAQTYWSFCTSEWSRYELAFILCSLCGIAGNLMLALSSIFKSLAISFFGRIVIGFASSDVLNRRLISCCVLRGGFVRESSKIVYVHAIAILCATLLAAIACSAPEDVMKEAVMSTNPVPHSLSQSPSVVVQSSGTLTTEISGQDKIDMAQSALHDDKSLLVLEILSFIMAFCWLLLLLAFLCAFQEPVEIRRFIGGGQVALHRLLDQYEQQPQEEAVTEDFDSDTSNCQDPTDTNMSIHRDSSCGTNLKSTYGTSNDGEEQAHLLNSRSSYMSTDNSIPDGCPETKKRWAVLSHALRIRALMCHNIALPVALVIFSLAEFTVEMVFSSCAMVTHRYFDWNDSMAAMLLSFLGISSFPICYIYSSIISRRDERSVMKNSAVAMGVGMGILLNYESLYTSLVHVRSLLRYDENYGRAFHPYDWAFGMYQYVLGVIVIFASSLTLCGASLSLMSKVAPTKLNYTAVNCALLVTTIGAFARIIADFVITLVGLSHLRINTDMINSLFMPLMFFCFAGFYLIKKHYFFLI